ncbi:MAG: hypothetical protein R2748_07315 [Bryobacterales bacterium]
MRAVLDQIRHLEEAERIDHGRHDGGGNGKIDGAQLELQQQRLVVAKLAGPENADVRAAFELVVGAARELLSRVVGHRARVRHMPQTQLERTIGLHTATGG